MHIEHLDHLCASPLAKGGTPLGHAFAIMARKPCNRSPFQEEERRRSPRVAGTVDDAVEDSQPRTARAYSGNVLLVLRMCQSSPPLSIRAPLILDAAAAIASHRQPSPNSYTPTSVSSPQLSPHTPLPITSPSHPSNTRQTSVNRQRIAFTRRIFNRPLLNLPPLLLVLLNLHHLHGYRFDGL